MVLSHKTKSFGNRHELTIEKYKTTIKNSNNKKKSKQHFLTKKSIYTKRHKSTKVFYKSLVNSLKNNFFFLACRFKRSNNKYNNLATKSPFK